MTTPPMRALTVQQPWAWSIIHGGRLIENRTQLWAYRGPVAVHAGARLSNRGMDDPRVRGAARDVLGRDLDPDPPEIGDSPLAFGAIIGVVDIVEAHPAAGCCTPWGETKYTEHGGRQRRDVVHLVLENPRALPEPIACRGALGLWTLPGDIADRCCALIDGVPARGQ